MALNYYKLNFSKFRQTLGLSQAFIAKKIGVSRMFVSLVECGKKDYAKPRLESVLSLYEHHINAEISRLEKELKRFNLMLPAIDICRKQNEIESE